MKRQNFKSSDTLQSTISQAVLWSKKIDKINTETDAGYIIHNILAYGTMEDLKWLFKKYSRQKIVKNFIENPIKVYTRPAFGFAAKTLLKIRKPLSLKAYVKTVF